MTLLDILNEYWVLITAFVTVVVSFVRMESAIRTLKSKDDSQEERIKAIEDQHKLDIDKIEKDLKSNNLEFKKIEVNLEALKSDVAFIKDIISKRYEK